APPAGVESIKKAHGNCICPYQPWPHRKRWTSFNTSGSVRFPRLPSPGEGRASACLLASCATVDRCAGLAAIIVLSSITSAKDQSERVPMSAQAVPVLNQVLKKLDATQDAALERLFELI